MGFLMHSPFLTCLFFIFFTTIIFSSSLSSSSTFSSPHSLPLRRVESLHWVPSKNLTLWYNEWERCLLSRNESSIVTNFKEDVRSCTDSKKKKTKKKQKVFFRCRLGNTYYSNTCVSGSATNMQDMKHLSMVVEGYDDPSRRPLYSFFNNILEKNGTFVMLGDSVMEQFASAITCELERENLAAFSWIKVAPRANIPDKDGHVKIKWERHVKVDDKFLASLEDWMRRMLQIKDSIFLIINTGIWYNNELDYTSAMNRLTKCIYRLVNVWTNHATPKYIAIVFAETTSQHYHTSNGYFDRQEFEQTKSGAFCRSIDQPIVDWRNDILWSYLQGEWGDSIRSLPHVYLRVLDMHALTKNLADIHLRQKLYDCTHFCYTPMLYQPIYSQLDMLSREFLSLRRIIIQ